MYSSQELNNKLGTQLCMIRAEKGAKGVRADGGLGGGQLEEDGVVLVSGYWRLEEV